MFSIIGADNGKIFAASIDGPIHTTTNLGISWSILSPRFSNVDVRSFVRDHHGHLFAATEGEGIFRSTDDGTTWVLPDSSLAGWTVFEIVVDSTANILYAAGSGGYLLRSTDDGGNWAVLPAPGPYRLAVSPNGNLYGGALPTEWSPGGVFRSTDHGESWTPSLLGSYAIVNGLATDSGGAIFVGLNDDRNLEGQIYRSLDDGESWALASEGLLKSRIISLSRDSRGYIWSGSTGGVCRSTDRGTTWEQLNKGLPYYPLEAVCVDSLGYIYAGGHGHSYMGNGILYRSTNDGLAWTTSASISQPIYVTSLGVRPDGAVFGGTAREYGSPNYTLIRSTDHGESWSLHGRFLSDAYALAFDLNGDILSGTAGGGVLRLPNDGENWAATGLSILNMWCYALAVDPAGRMYAGVSEYDSSMHRSTDGGDTWMRSDSGLGLQTVLSVAADGSGHVYAGTYNAGIFRSSDHGISWSNSMPYSWPVNALAINQTGEVFAGTGRGRVFRKRIGATDQWEDISGGLVATSITSLALDRDGYLVAGTVMNGVYKSVSPLLPVHPNETRPKTFTLKQAYPNPFNSRTMIEFELPSSALVTLRITDVLARDVVRIRDDEMLGPGRHTSPFDGSKLASGIYFYTIEVAYLNSELSPVSRTGKIVLVR